MYRVIKATTEVDPSLTGYTLKYHDNGEFVYRKDYVFPTLDKANEEAERSLKWKKKDIDVFYVENGELEYQSTFEYDPETVGPNSYDIYKEKEQQYLEANPDISVTNSHYVNGNDYRYNDIFQNLKSLGYKPRKTNSMSRMDVWDCITIDVPWGTREIPQEIEDLVGSYENITIWDAQFHNTKNKVRKLKFSLRDTYLMKTWNASSNS